MNEEELKKELIKKDREIQQLKRLVTIDPLTGLLNRGGTRKELERLFKEVIYSKEHKRNGRKHFFVDEFSILFIDIDNFKKLNDQYGHKIGDKILQFISLILKEKVRGIDIVGRWGGEELIVGLIGSPENDACEKAESIRKAIKSRVKMPSVSDLKITVSIGVSSADTAPTFDDIIDQADKAMYHAKHALGKDAVARYGEIKIAHFGKN